MIIFSGRKTSDGGGGASKEVPWDKDGASHVEEDLRYAARLFVLGLRHCKECRDLCVPRTFPWIGGFSLR